VVWRRRHEIEVHTLPVMFDQHGCRAASIPIAGGGCEAAPVALRLGTVKGETQT
jgi:hypothetical protein